MLMKVYRFEKNFDCIVHRNIHKKSSQEYRGHFPIEYWVTINWYPSPVMCGDARKVNENLILPIYWDMVDRFENLATCCI